MPNHVCSVGGLLPSCGLGRSLTYLFIVARALVLCLVLGWDVVEIRYLCYQFRILRNLRIDFFRLIPYRSQLAKQVKLIRSSNLQPQTSTCLSDSCQRTTMDKKMSLSALQSVYYSDILIGHIEILRTSFTLPLGCKLFIGFAP